MLIIATARDELRGREHLGIGDAESGVRRVDCRATHDNALPSQRFFSLILRLRPGFFIPQLPVVVLKSLRFQAFLKGGFRWRVDFE